MFRRNSMFFSRIATIVRFSFFILLGSYTPNVFPSDIPEVMFILDSSGSMSETIGRQKKIDLAKKVMHDIVPAIPTDVAVGLTVYGHRRSGDCSDIETMVTPMTGDRGVILSHVNTMKPVGKTPLAKSVLHVAAGIKLKDAETTIVLVSDGIDTCGDDPCKVVRDLKKSGIHFVLHTVGLDVNEKASKQLQCMAEEGNGQYFAAGDAKTFLDALKTVTVEVAGKAEAAKAEFIQAGSGLGKLRLVMPENSEKSLQKVQVIQAKDGKVIKDIEPVKADSLHPLLSGTYSLRTSFKQPNFGKPTETALGEFTISKGDTREIMLGSISLNVPAEIVKSRWETGLNIKKVVVVHAGTMLPVATVHDNKNGFYNFKPKPVLAGTYDVLFEYDSIEPSMTAVATNILVTEGKDTNVSLTTGIRMTGNLDEVLGWDLTPCDKPTDAAAEDGLQPTVVPPAVSVRTKTGISGKRYLVGCTYLVPAGTYNLHVFINGMADALPLAENLTIEDGKILEFDTGL